MIAPSMTVLPVSAVPSGPLSARWPAALAMLALLTLLAACSKPEVAAAPAEPTVAGVRKLRVLSYFPKSRAFNYGTYR